MTKILTVVLSAFICMPAMAAPSACFKGIEAARGWVPNPQMEDCIARDPKAADLLAGLCSANQKSFSPEYKKYREYEVAYLKALDQYKNATDEGDKFQAQADMRRMEPDWMLFGYRREIETLLLPLESIKRACGQQQ